MEKTNDYNYNKYTFDLINTMFSDNYLVKKFK